VTSNVAGGSGGVGRVTTTSSTSASKAGKALPPKPWAKPAKQPPPPQLPPPSHSLVLEVSLASGVSTTMGQSMPTSPPPLPPPPPPPPPSLTDAMKVNTVLPIADGPVVLAPPRAIDGTEAVTQHQVALEAQRWALSDDGLLLAAVGGGAFALGMPRCIFLTAF